MPATQGSSKRSVKASAQPLPARNRLKEVSAWLAGHQKLILILLVSLSILIRAGYYLEARGTPLLYGHLWNQGDMGFFDQWAKVIAGGDVLGKQPLHPYFAWQNGPAESYFRTHPEKVAEYESEGVPKGDTKALYRALWDRWTHGTEFYQEPLYVYLIALTYKIAGPHTGAVFAWQALLGICTNLLVYFLARRYFGEIAAAIAGIFVVFYSPLFLYDLVLLRTTLTAFLAAVVVAALEWSLASASWRRWALTGGAVGLAMTCQSTFVVFLAGCLVLIWMKFRPSMRTVTTLAAVTACSAGLVVSPIVIRNMMVGAPTFSWVGASVWTFIRFNTPSADPLRGPVIPVFPDHVRILAESDAKPIPAVLATLRDHTPGSLFTLMERKFEKLWSWYEEGDNVSFYFSRIYSAVLRYSPVTNTVISPLLLVGLGLFVRQWKRYAPLYLLAANGIFVLLVTFPTDRYRAPYFAVLIPLAAATLARLMEWIATKQTRNALVLAAVLAVVFFWTSLPLPESRRLIRVDYYGAPLGYYFMPAHERAVKQQNWMEAARVAEQFLQSEPADLLTSGDATLIRVFASGHYTLGDDLQKTGDSARGLAEAGRGNMLAAAAAQMHKP